MSYQPKTNWQLDDIVMPDDMNRIEGGIVDLENNVDTKATKTMYTATIPTTGWTGYSGLPGGYIDVTVTGLLSTDNPLISPVITLSPQATGLLEQESWNKITKIVASNDKIRVYCYEEIPTTPVNIQIMCIR